MTSDSELLTQFARSRSEQAFAELVRRHVNLVYSAALRQVGGDAHLAEDVSQMVFSDLARKAPALARRPSLTGWLYTSARFAAAKVVRSEHRRRGREEEFMREPTEATPEANWEQIRPALDEMMHELDETDREAILLRYFESRPYAEIAERCGLNENAARMRVDRALEKLRARLAKHGITTAASLASLISANAVQTAPVSFVTSLAATSLAGAGSGGIAFWNLMNMTKIGLGILVVAGASTALMVQHQAAKKLGAENKSLSQQVAQLRADNDRLTKVASQEKPALPPDDHLNELLRLRGEVGMLRQQTNDLGRLRQENQRLLSQVAAQTQSTNQVSSEDDFILRHTHAVDAMSALLNAVKAYGTNSNGQYPTNFEQLITAGDLKTTNFAGNLSVTDFEFAKEGARTSSGDPLILRIRVPLEKSDGNSEIVLGAFDQEGLPETITMNVAPKTAGPSTVSGQ